MNRDLGRDLLETVGAMYMANKISDEIYDSIVECVKNHDLCTEPTEYQVIQWCKAHNLTLVTNDFLEDLLRRH